MSRSRRYNPMTCQNPDCQHYLIEEGKDIVRNGKTSAGHQQYFCKHCRRYFVETKNTPLYHAHLDRREVEIICKHSMEKTSIRGVARVTGHHQDTVARYYRLIGEHADILNEHFLQPLSRGGIELDELWTFIQKK